MESGHLFVMGPLLVFGCSGNANFILSGRARKIYALLYPVHSLHTVNILCAALVN